MDFFPHDANEIATLWNFFFLGSVLTYLDFCDVGANTAVHSMESDGVKLALVQVDHRQLVGLVRGSQRSSQGELELIPEPLCRGAGIGARVDRAGLILRKGIAVGKWLKTHKEMCL